MRGQREWLTHQRPLDTDANGTTERGKACTGLRQGHWDAVLLSHASTIETRGSSSTM
jgi:hypothetical protein